MASMQLQDILFSQGFGTRRVCAGLIQQGFVAVANKSIAEPAMEFVAAGLQFTVQGVAWEYHEKAYLMLHKKRAGAEPAVAALVAKPDSPAETARELCYSLYMLCECKKRTASPGLQRSGAKAGQRLRGWRGKPARMRQ